MKTILFILIVGIMLVYPVVSADTNMSELKAFLEADTTDNHSFSRTYQCGHCARQLSENATVNNVSIGSILLGMNRTS